jgi:hypothetical protein
MEVNKTAPNTFTGSKLTQTAGTLGYAGTLTVSASGSTLAGNDAIPLFVNNLSLYSGGFSAVSGPTAPAGLVTDATQLTGGTGGNITMICDGTLAASAGSGQTICAGSGVAIGGSLTASGGSGSGYTYAWSPPTGLDNAALANPTASPSITTLYTVTVTDSVGCTAQSQVTVTVNPLPTTSAITGSTTVNANQADVHYSVGLTSGSSYGWTVPTGATITSGGSGPNNNEIIVTFGTASGNVAVTETNTAGCVGSTVSLAVDVQNPLAAVTISNIVGTTLTYGGGSGSQFVLLTNASVDAPMSTWGRAETNPATPGTFAIPAVGSSAQIFYRIQSE